MSRSSKILETPLTVPNLMSSVRLIMAIAAAVLFAMSHRGYGMFLGSFLSLLNLFKMVRKYGEK